MDETYNRHWIPLDVVGCIFEQLATEDPDDASTLKACSTVCRDFTPLCQKRIFANVALCDDDSRQQALRRLECLLRRKPQISDYIRAFGYQHCVDSEMAVTFIFSSLRCATTFDLTFCRARLYQPPPSWSMITPSFENALFSFLSSNNIARLTLEHVDNIPRTIFGRIPGLVSLKADCVTLDISESEELCPQLAVPKLKSLVTERRCKSFVEALLLPQARTFIDFSLLEDVKVSIGYRNPGMGLIAKIISQSHKLKSIYISEGVSSLINMCNTLSSSLYAESLRTLMSITLDVMLDSNDQDPYCHLSSELAKISGTNSIEEIKLFISIGTQTDPECTTELQHWSSLDDVLSQQGGFLSLRRIKIEVAIYYCMSDAEDLQSKLLFIRDNAFPLLSTWDQVEFSMTVETYSHFRHWVEGPMPSF